MSSLKSLPNIPKWNINNIKNMSTLFFLCLTLTSSPEITKWNGYEYFI